MNTITLPHVLPISPQPSTVLTFPPTSAEETLMGRYSYGELAASGEVVSFEVFVRTYDGVDEAEADIIVCVDDQHRYRLERVPTTANVAHVLSAIQGEIRSCQGLLCGHWDEYEDEDEEEGHVLGSGTPLPIPKELLLVGDDLKVEEGDGVVYWPFQERLLAHAWRRAYQLLQAG